MINLLETWLICGTVNIILYNYIKINYPEQYFKATQQIIDWRLDFIIQLIMFIFSIPIIIFIIWYVVTSYLNHLKKRLLSKHTELKKTK